MFSGLLQNDLFKGRCSLAKVFSNKIIVTIVTQGFPSCCVSSLLLTREARSRGALVAMGKTKKGRICLSLSFFPSLFALLSVRLLDFRSPRAILAS